MIAGCTFQTIPSIVLSQTIPSIVLAQTIPSIVLSHRPFRPLYFPTDHSVHCTFPDHSVHRTLQDHSVHCTFPDHSVHRTLQDHFVHRTFKTLHTVKYCTGLHTKRPKIKVHLLKFPKFSKHFHQEITLKYVEYLSFNKLK